MVSKIKGPRNYLSCCHVLTAMGRGQRAGGASSQKSLGWQAHSTQAGRAPALSPGHPQPPPDAPLSCPWPKAGASDTSQNLAQEAGMVEAGRHLLSFCPQTPSKLWEGGGPVCFAHCRGSLWAGAWGKEGVRCPTPPGPFTVAGDGSQTPQGRAGQYQGQGQVKGTVAQGAAPCLIGAHSHARHARARVNTLTR